MNAESLDQSKDEEFITLGLEANLRPRTARIYRSRYRSYLVYLRKSGKPDELQSFIDFLSAIKRQGAAGTTLSGYRAAVLHHQRIEGKLTYAADPNLLRALKGFKYQHRLEAKPRGAINISMLDQLCTFAPKFAAFFRTSFLLVLRVSQTVSIISGDFELLRENRGRIKLREDKRLTARERAGITQKVHRKPIISTEGVRLMQALQDVTPEGQPIFAWVNQVEANRAIHEAARRFQWPGELTFDGVHCLRHGGANWHAQIFGNTALVKRVCAMSEPTFRWYSRTNEARLSSK